MRARDFLQAIGLSDNVTEQGSMAIWVQIESKDKYRKLSYKSESASGLEPARHVCMRTVCARKTEPLLSMIG